jgi:23S rRNA U2552 (ribose-2'-O)-methylase RlmE/FtsJ
MDYEERKLSLIRGGVETLTKSIREERLKKSLSECPDEYFEVIVSSMIEYISSLEDCPETQSIYFNLHDALFWWQAYTGDIEE